MRVVNPLHQPQPGVPRTHRRKKRVIKFHNFPRRAVVHLQRFRFQHPVQRLIPQPQQLARLGFARPRHQGRRVALVQAQNLLHLAPAPAVNGLLGIAHRQAAVPVGQRVFHQRQQVIPLQYRRILKLVNQNMLVFLAQPLVQKRHRLGEYNAGNAPVKFRNQHHIPLPANLLHHLI